MKKPPQTRRELQKAVTVSRLRSRMELVLDFDRPISVQKSREAARRILDHLDLVLMDLDLPDELGEATIRCSEFKRIVRIRLNPES